MTTKEELDEAIKYIDEYCGNAPEILTALTILTKYRDGELVEKQPIKYFQIMGKDTIFTTDLLPTPPTNQTETAEQMHHADCQCEECFRRERED